VLDLPPTFDAYLAALGKSLRYDVKRFDKLGVTLRIATEASLDADLQTFFDLHQARWKGRGLPGAFVGSRVKQLHRMWGRAALPLGRLWLATLEHEGRAVGSIYIMRTGQACFFYQAGMDPEAKALSPGTLLVSQMIRLAIEEGHAVFDFMRGDEPYKRRWKPQHEVRNMRLLMGSGLRGTVGERWNRTGHDIEMKVRKRLEG
jgi:CelD/BcsL family acetyltransferase involved in cellulose biosynthesis